jgi:hypothetical protein
MRIARCVLIAALCNASCSDDAVTSPTEVTSPVTITWTSQLVPGGAASRTLTLTQSGTVSVRLQSAPVPIGLGVGVPQASGSGCHATISTTASPGALPQLTAPVDAGTYCVMVFDVVGITNPFTFSVEVVHP